MTPERLNELADWLTNKSGAFWSIEEKEISLFLRECAKAEPVGTIINRDASNFLFTKYEIAIDKMDLPVGTKLYAAPQVSQSPSPIDEREAFEKWAYEQKFTLLRDEKSGEYLFAHAELAWEAWQAARKLSATVVPDKKTGLCVSDEADTFEIEQAAAYANGWNACRATVIRETE